MEKVINLGPLTVFNEKFLVANGYELYEELPELELKIYKNKTHIIGVDFKHMNGSIHLIRNAKNFERILGIMKEEFAKYLQK